MDIYGPIAGRAFAQAILKDTEGMPAGQRARWIMEAQLSVPTQAYSAFLTSPEITEYCRLNKDFLVAAQLARGGCES